MQRIGIQEKNKVTYSPYMQLSNRYIYHLHVIHSGWDGVIQLNFVEL